MFIKKIKKFLNSPEIFLRDYFLKRKPIIRNEIRCPVEEEAILLKHDLEFEEIINTTFPIDVVYTWVDDRDDMWVKRLEKFSLRDNVQPSHEIDHARFENHNELYYSVSSVLKNMPWVRKIFIVTDSQQPQWSQSFNTDKIKIIDHKDIIDGKFLPTFNSHVIEAHLHLIPDLSEQFIYFNDDVFVSRELPASHFFKSNGLASLFLSKKSLMKMRTGGVSTPTLSASLNSSNILRELGMEVDSPLVHTYVPLTKSGYDYVWSHFRDRIELFLGNKFRESNDLNLATFLVPWVSYTMGNAYPNRDICYYFNIRSAHAKSFYRSMDDAMNTKTMPHSICANDFSANNLNVLPEYNNRLVQELNKYFEI